eukprot:CAMPEP_0184658066 /NCGR_PEP_ID=MMETSP0308-20130426/23358_1 /TAXON_ID=38269 /ORGANISM="Gloeochaete witrockiana, Strain SAG 46.84" /LENGTH=335 /DNA_ID=CAMNT_0027096653 /DNA_START=63 /DNA_END=1068 /DNA_ORIENTATION=-
MAKFRGLLFLVFALVAGNVVFGDSFSSTTVGMPRWRRPTENGNNPPYQLSVVGNYCPYTVTPFNVSTAGTYRILTNGTEPSGWYIYTFLYGSSFDPTNQLVNVMVGNAAQPEEGISVLTVDLLADAQYILIVTGLRDYDEGAYTVSISDMSAPPLIEEPLAPATATATPTPTRTPTRVVSCSSNAQCGSLKAAVGRNAMNTLQIPRRPIRSAVLAQVSPLLVMASPIAVETLAAQTTCFVGVRRPAQVGVDQPAGVASGPGGSPPLCLCPCLIPALPCMQPPCPDGAVHVTRPSVEMACVASAVRSAAMASVFWLKGHPYLELLFCEIDIMYSFA